MLIDFDWDNNGTWEDTDNVMPWDASIQAYKYTVSGGDVVLGVYGATFFWMFLWYRECSGVYYDGFFFWYCDSSAFSPASGAFVLNTSPPDDFGASYPITVDPSGACKVSSYFSEASAIAGCASNRDGYYYSYGSDATPTCSGVIFSNDAGDWGPGLGAPFVGILKFRVKWP
jgi:hypothetical protein